MALLHVLRSLDGKQKNEIERSALKETGGFHVLAAKVVKNNLQIVAKLDKKWYNAEEKKREVFEK